MTIKKLQTNLLALNAAIEIIQLTESSVQIANNADQLFIDIISSIQQTAAVFKFGDTK